MGTYLSKSDDPVSGLITEGADGDFSETVAHVDYPGKLVEKNEGCWQIWEENVKKFGESNCMAFREYMADGERGEYKSWSYNEVNSKVEMIGDGIGLLNVGNERNVGIWSKNCPEWMLSCLACWRQGCKVVPFYDTLGAEAMLYILELTEIVVLFTEASRLDTILELVRDSKETSKLETIVVMDPTDIIINDETSQGIDQPLLKKGSCDAEEFKLLDLCLMKLSDFDGSSLGTPMPGNGGDIAIIMFTSGTTGKPKGVLLAHSNMATSAYSGSCMIKDFPEAIKDLRYYSYLPLPHIFEMGMESIVFSNGGCVYYHTGDIKKLVEELNMVKPTIFAGVPRVYQKFYDRIMLGAQSGLKGWILRQSLSKDGYMTRYLGIRHYILNSFLSLVAGKLGLSQCDLLISGAAPLPQYLHEFLRTLIPGVAVMQGYGMTETTACGTIMRPHDITGGHVGGPTLVNYVKLRDVPEMNRLHTNSPPDGEILIGGPTVFKGYYKNQEKTSETLFEHSGIMWVATGDIGVINSNKSIKIVDRKKNIFKLAHGEYIAVEKIEMAYSKCPAVNQVWVYGNSYKTCIVAVVNPSLSWVWDQDFFTKKSDIDPLNPKAAGQIYAEWLSLSANRDILTRACLAEMRKYEENLKGFEKVKAIHLEKYVGELGTAFTPENNLLTPSMKLMRPKLKVYYLSELQNMYTGLGMPPQDGENWV